MRPAWTRSAPTERGWYWERQVVSGFHSRAVGVSFTTWSEAYIVEYRRPRGVGTPLERTTSPCGIDSEEVEWSGPIEEPAREDSTPAAAAKGG